MRRIEAKDKDLNIVEQRERWVKSVPNKSKLS